MGQKGPKMSHFNLNCDKGFKCDKYVINLNSLKGVAHIYDNEYTLIIDIYFYEYFHWALALQNILDTLSDILDKCLRFSLIKIEPVSLYPSQATLGLFFSSVVYTFLLK